MAGQALPEGTITLSWKEEGKDCQLQILASNWTVEGPWLQKEGAIYPKFCRYLRPLPQFTIQGTVAEGNVAIGEGDTIKTTRPLESRMKNERKWAWTLGWLALPLVNLFIAQWLAWYGPEWVTEAGLTGKEGERFNVLLVIGWVLSTILIAIISSLPWQEEKKP